MARRGLPAQRRPRRRAALDRLRARDQPCLAAEAPASAETYADSAIRIFEQIGAHNDLAKAMVARAELRQSAGEAEAARSLLEQARAMFQALGTRGEFARIDAALAAINAAGS